MPEPRHPTSKLLVVDDRKENLIALSALLQDEGYELIEALSGQEALQLAHHHDFMAILMDVQMPDLDGFQTASLLRQNLRHRNTPVIFVTAIHRSEENEERGYLAGAIDYLFKPINANILKAKLSVFSELQKQRFEIERQSQSLKEKAVKEKENQLLKESLRARDQFLSMASHELKTPITPLTLQMQAFLQMVQEGTFSQAEPERLQRMLETSYSQVVRLSKTIDDLIAVSRFSTGHLELRLKKVNLNDLIRRILDAFAIQLKEVGCNYTVDQRNKVVGFWDPDRIEQVFINLLSNSMKYASGKPIHIQVDQIKDKARILVIDNGIGIAREDQERIFHRFERAVSPEFYGGLGLGLYISCEIVRLHKGSIHVESELGKGATFIVELPLQDMDPS